jgi:hypothetical protein
MKRKLISLLLTATGATGDSPTVDRGYRNTFSDAANIRAGSGTGLGF